MRLEKVTGNPVWKVRCIGCLEMVQVGDTPPRNFCRKVGAWADLEGEPFVDYYCEECRIIIARSAERRKVNDRPDQT